MADFDYGGKEVIMRIITPYLYAENETTKIKENANLL